MIKWVVHQILTYPNSKVVVFGSQQQNMFQRAVMPPPLPTNLGSRGEGERVMQKRHLNEVLRSIDPMGQLDEEVEEVGACLYILFHWY